jgi:hypothetical protein
VVKVRLYTLGTSNVKEWGLVNDMVRLKL